MPDSVICRRLALVALGALSMLIIARTSAQNPPDTTPPAVVAAGSADGSEIFVCWSEPLDFDTAVDTFNYSVNSSTIVVVQSATLSADGITVTLQVAGLSNVTNTYFTVTVSNVKDLAQNYGGGTALGRVGDYFHCPRDPLPTDLKITSANAAGYLTWTNAFTNGVFAVETATNIRGPWQPQPSLFTSAAVGITRVNVMESNLFCRFWAADVSATPEGATNLFNAYGVLQTIAGAGLGRTDGFNYWLPDYEGGPATNAALSRPHFAIADKWDNIYIADKDGAAILKITPDGNIHTLAGTHEPGYNGDGPALGTTLQLTTPTGEWLRDDGTLYILDTGNGKVRRIENNGVMTTVFTITNGIQSMVNGITITNGILGGRGLWVKDDESLAFFTTDHVLWRWTPETSFTAVNTNFVEMGNIWVLPTGQIVATDRVGNRVWLVETNGDLTPFAGDGTSGIGVDGAYATDCPLYGVRGVWPMPNGGWLFATHEGSQVWYMDSAHIMHRFVDGAKSSHTHSGDGDWFYTSGWKISSVRNVTLDSHNNVLILENDFGYLRKVTFQRFTP